MISRFVVGGPETSAKYSALRDVTSWSAAPSQSDFVRGAMLGWRALQCRTSELRKRPGSVTGHIFDVVGAADVRVSDVAARRRRACGV